MSSQFCDFCTNPLIGAYSIFDNQHICLACSFKKKIQIFNETEFLNNSVMLDLNLIRSSAGNYSDYIYDFITRPRTSVEVKALELITKIETIIESFSKEVWLPTFHKRVIKSTKGFSGELKDLKVFCLIIGGRILLSFQMSENSYLQFIGLDDNNFTKFNISSISGKLKDLNSIIEDIEDQGYLLKLIPDSNVFII